MTALDRYIELLRVWERSVAALAAVDPLADPLARAKAELAVADAQAAAHEFKDSICLSLSATLRWLRDSGRYDDCFESLVAGAVAAQIGQAVQGYKGRIRKLEDRVTDLEAKLQELLTEKEENERKLLAAGEGRGAGQGTLPDNGAGGRVHAPAGRAARGA